MFRSKIFRPRWTTGGAFAFLAAVATKRKIFITAAVVVVVLPVVLFLLLDARVGRAALPWRDGMPSVRDLVVRAADAPTDENHAAVLRALPDAILYFRLTGLPAGRHGEKLVVTDEDARFEMVRLPNGMQMIATSCAPPRSISSGQQVVTMSGREALQALLRTQAAGLAIMAEDDRQSWTAITREAAKSALGQ